MPLQRTLIILVLTLWPAFVFAQGFSPSELIVEALIDGPSTFHLRAEGVYWVNGANGKPGKHQGHDDPTFINDRAWRPRWSHSKEDRGPDRCEIYRIPFGTIDVDFQLLAITELRGESGIQHRTEVAAKREGNEFIVTIPDPEPGHRWYKFVLRKRPKL
jgi:hypothetical protein